MFESKWFLLITKSMLLNSESIINFLKNENKATGQNELHLSSWGQIELAHCVSKYPSHVYLCERTIRFVSVLVVAAFLQT